MADLSIMYQPLAGGWVKLGTQHGGGRGVMAESIRLEGDRGEGGCLSCSFKLKQDPRWIQTEMEKATPIVVMDGAEAIWSGRIAETPMTFGEDDIEVGVNAQGWWQHLKDDCTDREWVIDDLSRWVDLRTTSAARLTWTEDAQNWQVALGGNEISTGFGNGVTIKANSRCGIVLDLGPNGGAKSFSIDWQGSNNHVYSALYCVGHNSTYWAVAPQETITGPKNNTGTSGQFNGTFTTTYRYVTILHHEDTADVTSGGDVFFKFTGIRVFTDSADVSAGASILKASTVISETLDACAPLISSRRDRITTTALSLPQFPGSPGWRYADELIKQANAPHGYLARLTPDPVPVFEYFPVPTDYRFVLGEGQYTLLEPAAQALQGVASRVITEYEDASGVRSYAEAGTSTYVSAATQLANGEFETNASNWAAGNGSISRDTGSFKNGVASLRLTTSAGGDSVCSSDYVQLRPNSRYQLQFSLRRFAAVYSANVIVYPQEGLSIEEELAQSSVNGAQIVAQATGSFVTYTVPFLTGDSGRAMASFSLTGPNSVQLVNIDALVIQERGGSIVDRRGFRRTFLRPMSQRSTSATAQAIADLELDAAQFPPFKGTLGVTGRIPLKGGGSMDVSHLPACVGDNILLANLHDPNTQGLGRIGNIQSCVYDHDKRQAIIGIDRDLSFITELRNRLSLFAR